MCKPYTVAMLSHPMRQAVPPPLIVSDASCLDVVERLRRQWQSHGTKMAVWWEKRWNTHEKPMENMEKPWRNIEKPDCFGWRSRLILVLMGWTWLNTGNVAIIWLLKVRKSSGIHGNFFGVETSHGNKLKWIDVYRPDAKRGWELGADESRMSRVWECFLVLKVAAEIEDGVRS